MTALAHDLATELGGQILPTSPGGPLIMVVRTDAVDIVDCTPTGEVVVRTKRAETDFRLGRFSDGAPALAAVYFAWRAAERGAVAS